MNSDTFHRASQTAHKQEQKGKTEEDGSAERGGGEVEGLSKDDDFDSKKYLYWEFTETVSRPTPGQAKDAGFFLRLEMLAIASSLGLRMLAHLVPFAALQYSLINISRWFPVVVAVVEEA